MAQRMHGVERPEFANCGRVLFKIIFELVDFVVAFTYRFSLLYAFIFAGLGLAVSIS